jgi:hypothetical protein
MQCLIEEKISLLTASEREMYTEFPETPSEEIIRESALSRGDIVRIQQYYVQIINSRTIALRIGEIVRSERVYWVDGV